MCYSIMVEQDIRKLALKYGAKIDQLGFDEYLNNSKVNPKKFKPLADNPRIYPNYWAPVMYSKTDENNKQGLFFTPMRYRVRPRGSTEEIPAKYNIFNCRLDSIETRATWKKLFLRRHGVLVFKSFYEWVVDQETGKKRVINFFPDDGRLVICPVLWDEWKSPDNKAQIRSFAVITTEPPPEVLAKGHDRCPVFMRESNLDLWLNVSHLSKVRAFAILNDIEPVTYESLFAA